MNVEEYNERENRETGGAQDIGRGRNNEWERQFKRDIRN